VAALSRSLHYAQDDRLESFLEYHARFARPPDQWVRGYTGYFTTRLTIFPGM